MFEVSDEYVIGEYDRNARTSIWMRASEIDCHIRRAHDRISGEEVRRSSVGLDVEGVARGTASGGKESAWIPGWLPEVVRGSRDGLGHAITISARKVIREGDR